MTLRPVPEDAGQTAPATRVGGKVAARQGVLSALPRSNRFPADHAHLGMEDPSPERPGIRISAPPVYRSQYDGARWAMRYGDTPTAAWACACAQTGTAAGPSGVAALIAQYDAHKAACGEVAGATEGRRAA